MKKQLLSLCLSLFVVAVVANERPKLLLTKGGVAEMREAVGVNKLFDKSMHATIIGADRAISKSIVVPVPKDGGGGYTHERHKLNYYEMFDCGVAYQMTNDDKYAQYVVDMLLEYADMYPTLNFHPLKLSSTPGRIFWQTLNESVWLVHTSVAYDCVYEYLTSNERKRIEENLFYPMANFIMNGMDSNVKNNLIFNQMNNHATWGTAAVGMIGLVMDNEEFVDMALYGSDKSGANGGFMRQLDTVFSPDGYFTEGAYYLRYAIWPFVMFAESINNNIPELKIFKHRDSIITKSVESLIQLAYEGEFFRFNNALTKGYDAQELIYAVDIAYKADPSNKTLLDIASRYQGKFLPTDAGYAVARDIAKGEAKSVKFYSKLYADGPDGSQGGIAVIRSTDPQLNTALTLKATAQGTGHGHYDKLAIAYYNNGDEVLTDYGSVRFLNIEAKNKGHYTKENRSFSMTTIAHNTLSVDEKQQFGGNLKVSSKHHSDIYFTDFAEEIQIVSAKESNGYPGVNMHRTTAYITTDFLQYPLIFDIVRAESQTVHQYDLPYYFNGHHIYTNFTHQKALTTMGTLGKNNGYQHLWVEAWGQNQKSNTTCFTWITGDKFYSLNTATTPGSELKIVRIGANDPNFNLRSEQGYLIREKDKKNHTFFSSLETHGTYDLQVEQSSNLDSSCIETELLVDTPEYTVVKATYIGGYEVILSIANRDSSKKTKHKVVVGDDIYKWQGVYSLIKK